MATARPASVATQPAAAPRWRRIVLRAGIALLVLALLAWGGFTWLFYDPFEGTIERIDRVIPASAGVAVRGSLDALLAAPMLEDRLRGRPEVQDLLARGGLEDALRQVGEAQDRLNAGLPGFLRGFDLRRDLLGRETAVFGVLAAGGDGPVLARAAVATRVSPRARMLLSVLKHEWARRRLEAETGLRITRFPLFYEIDLSARGVAPPWATVWAALAGDVLILGNDRALVSEAAHLAATGGGGSLPDRPDAGVAFSAEVDAPLRAWVDLTRLALDRAAAGRPTPGEAAAGLEGIPGMLATLVDPAALATAQATARFPSAESVVLDLAGVRSEAALPILPDAMTGVRGEQAAQAVAEAAALAPAESAILAARLEVPASVLFKALYARMVAAGDVREEIEKAMKESGASLDEFARELDDYLKPGVSVVLERLPDCDAIPLDQYGAVDGKFVLPLPGLLLAFHERPSAGDGAAERLVRRRLDEWKDRWSRREEISGLPGGARGIRFRPKMLTGEKELVQPAAAFDGDLLLVATNEGTLRRALEARSGKAPDGSPRPSLASGDGLAEAADLEGAGQAAAMLGVEGFRRHLRDGRREAATGMIRTDPAEQRRLIHRDVALHAFESAQQVNVKDVEAEVDRRMEEAQRVLREVEFPRAVERYLHSLEPWQELRDAVASLDWDTAGFRLRLLLRAEPKPEPKR